VFEVKKTVIKENSSGSSSYGQILKSSSIIGGSEAINQIIGLLRTKIVAVLIGPSGVGLVSLYMSAAGFLGVVSQMGLSQSGVREVADANGRSDRGEIAQLAKALRRLCWITGFLGWSLTAALAVFLSQLTFASADHAVPIAILGCTILFTSLVGGSLAVINGLRRISDLAWIQIATALWTTLLAVGVYGVFGQSGIIPVIILTGVIQALVAAYYARKMEIEPVAQAWSATFVYAKKLIGLGVAFMYTGILVNVAGLATKALVVRNLDVSAAGLYQSAWNISVLFATFVLGAMGRDFFPRLTEATSDNRRMGVLVNEQMEIAMLLTLPGVVGVMVFADIVMPVLYSAEFAAASSMLPWMLLGVFARALSWPIGYILLARSEGKLYSISATVFLLFQIALTWVLLPVLGLVGAAIAFAIAEILQCLLYWALAKKAADFRLMKQLVPVFVPSVLFIICAGLLYHLGKPWLTWSLGTLLVFFSLLFSGRSIAQRIDEGSKVHAMLAMLPWGKALFGLK